MKEAAFNVLNLIISIVTGGSISSKCLLLNSCNLDFKYK